MTGYFVVETRDCLVRNLSCGVEPVLFDVAVIDPANHLTGMRGDELRISV